MAFGLSFPLFGRAGKSYRDFPSFPLYLPLGVASVRGPEHTRVQRQRGNVINDEFEGVMVTRNLQTVGELAEKEETDTQKSGEGDSDPENNDNQRRPRNRGLQLVKHGARTAADEYIQIFLPALPHRAKRSVHSHAHDSLPRTKP